MNRIMVHTLLLTALLMLATALPCAAEPMRAMQVDLDYVYDADAGQTERNLQALVERVEKIRPDAVFLQAFADPQGTGVAKALYFPNRQLPMRANLFAQTVKELKERTHIKVFGWLPVFSYALRGNPALVQAWVADGRLAIDKKAYRRVSPYDKQAAERIEQIYEDLAKAAPIDGILFHDDATLSDFEDATPTALKAYEMAGLPGTIKELRASPAMLKAWSDFKTDTLIAYTRILAEHVRKFRPGIEIARNIYAPVMLDAQSSTWFAQDYDKFLSVYDYTAVEAMPRMEKINDEEAHAWLEKLIAVADAHPNGIQRTIFQLQAVDWNLTAAGKPRAIPDEIFAAQLRLLTQQGVTNVAYYPDDFITDTPKLTLLRKDFSLQTGLSTP